MDKVDLRADLENRIYNQKKKNNVPKWLFFSALAACAIMILIYLNSDVAILQNKEKTKQPGGLNQLLNESKSGGITPQLSKPVAVKPKSVSGPSIEQWVPKDEEKQREKQTVFTDDNYQPRGSVNTMIPPPSRYYATSEARSKAQVSEIFRSIAPPVEKRTIPWQWKSEKKYRSGTFTYTQRNGKIETHTICRNYKYGSFEYRDCRKAAKKYFKDVCSSQFAAACLASEMIP